MQRRYVQSLGQAGLPPGHIPGVYPPASLASDLLARERERIERLGKLCLFFTFSQNRNMIRIMYAEFTSTLVRLCVQLNKLSVESEFNLSAKKKKKKKKKPSTN